MMFPLTTYRGWIIPFWDDYCSGHWFAGLYKKRIRTLFGPIALACVWKQRRSMSWYHYRDTAIQLLSGHYDVRVELFDDNGQMADSWTFGERPTDQNPSPLMMMVSCYSLIDGGYVGEPDTALMLLKRGIQPEKYEGATTCLIGFCDREQKWYGWARAMHGFGIGSTVKKGEIGYTPSNPDELIEEVRDYYCVAKEGESISAENQPTFTVEDGNLVITIPCYSGIFDTEYIPLGRGEWTAQSLDDARQMATDFAKGCA